MAVIEILDPAERRLSGGWIRLCRCGWALVGLFMLLARGFCGAEAAPDFQARLAPVPLCGALLAAARTNQIPVESIDPMVEADTIGPGDSVTAVVTLFEKGPRQTQWLLYVQSVAPEPKERAENSAKKMVIYNTFGNRLEFLSSPTFATVRIIGPFNAAGGKAANVQDRKARLVLDRGYLGLGLDQAVAAAIRMKESKNTGSLASGTAPFSEAQISSGRKLAAALKITPAEERAFGGTYPALLSYFGTVQNTPGLQDILMRVLDRPSIWSILRHGGVNSVNFNWQIEQLCPADVSSWNIPAALPAYHLPMVVSLNKHPSLNLTLVVTPPRPPLLACGGIIGVLAEKPGDKEIYLTLRVISARRGREKP